MNVSPVGSTRRWLIGVLGVLTAGWMAFDGAHALVTGDFVTAASGDHAGQLGPWASLLGSLGLDPRDTGVKVFFLAFGLTYLGVLVAFLRGQRRARRPLIACAAVALLYLPFGTMTSAFALWLLLRRPPP